MNEAIHLQDNLLLVSKDKRQRESYVLSTHISLKTRLGFWFLLHTLALCGPDDVARETRQKR
jgi:hypothetical protein